MDARELRRLKPELESFLDRYAPHFGRPEGQGHARRFVQGLLLGGDRRSVENIAEAIDGCVVRSLQQFIATAPWDAAAVLAEQRGQVGPSGGPGRRPDGGRDRVPDEEDQVGRCETAVLRDAGADRELPGRGVPGGTTRRRATPSWTAGCSSRRSGPPTGRGRSEAGVPEGVIFRAEPELALAMVADAAVAGVPFRWVAEDSVYGDSPAFCQGVRALGKWYVLDSSADARVWLAEPTMTPAGRKPTRGRPTTKPRPTTRPVGVDEAVAWLPAGA